MKAWYKSKQIWFNIVMAALETVNELSGTVIPTHVAFEITAVGNIVIRWVFGQTKIVLKMPKPPEVPIV